MKYGRGDVCHFWAEADKEVYIFRVSSLIYKLTYEEDGATQWKELGSLNIDVEGGWATLLTSDCVIEMGNFIVLSHWDFGVEMV